MRKLVIAIITILSLTGCASRVDEEVPTPAPKVTERYTAYGRYYTNGIVITNDGNEWYYATDVISERSPYDGMPVWIGFDDNGTDTIYDDIILGLVYDINTAIYDALEDAMSESFEVEREGNNLKISPIEH